MGREVRLPMNGDARNDHLLPMNLSFAKCRLRLREAPFPLTPTLSPRERENRFLIWSAKRFWFVRRRAAQFPLPGGEGESHPDLELAPTLWFVERNGRRGSLSPRERAGVRGNRMLVNPMRQTYAGSRVQSAEFSFREILSPGRRS